MGVEAPQYPCEKDGENGPQIRSSREQLTSVWPSKDAHLWRQVSQQSLVTHRSGWEEWIVCCCLKTTEVHIHQQNMFANVKRKEDEAGHVHDVFARIVSLLSMLNRLLVPYLSVLLSAWIGVWSAPSHSVRSHIELFWVLGTQCCNFETFQDVRFNPDDFQRFLPV